MLPMLLMNSIRKRRAITSKKSINSKSPTAFWVNPSENNLTKGRIQMIRTFVYAIVIFSAYKYGILQDMMHLTAHIADQIADVRPNL